LVLNLIIIIIIIIISPPAQRCEHDNIDVIEMCNIIITF